MFNTRLFAASADLTGRSNKVSLAAEVEEKDVTTFLAEGDADTGWKKVMGTLASSTLAAEGFWEAGDEGKVDDEAWANLGSVIPFTICPVSGAVGEVAYLLKALRSQYKLGAAVGDVAPWTAGATGSWPVPRGKILHPSGTARTATGSGTAVELAAVTADQYLYSTLHVLSVSGTSTPTVTVKVQSDVDNTFASPTDQITFTAATAIGGQISRTAGAITDTWFRVSFTISGSSPSFLFVVGLGVK
jgi:hypothetical protein